MVIAMDEELYAQWQTFRGERNEIERLEEVTGQDRNQCIDLSQAFWQRWTHETAQNAL